MISRHSKTSLFLLLSWVGISVGTSGCGALFGGMRRDLNDNQPQQAPYTSGGQWPEHGFLADDMSEGGNAYNSIGHSERNPASVGSGNSSDGSSSWAPQGQNGQSPAFSNSPNMDPPTKRLYKNGNRATRADFVDSSQNEGSLWASDGQTNYYFTKNKIRGVGDIISVKMENLFIKDVGSEIQRTLSSDERNAELQSAQIRMAGGAPAAAAPTPAASGAPDAQAAASPTGGGPTPASVGGANPTDKDIDLTKSIDVKDGDPVMAEIVERYPNGNYKIRGSKKVMYKNGPPRMVTVVGVARGTDIAEDDTIPSGKLYEYRLEAFK
jgi:flagellar L-ring protein precursor FlgH